MNPAPGPATVPRWVLPALLLLTAAAQAPALRGGFVYDDSWTLLANPVVRQPANLWPGTLLGPALARADIPDAGRPVMLASEIVDWWLWGRAPLGHHLQSLLWHLGVVWLCFRLLLGLGVGLTGAAAAAALHAVHPLHVEAVAVINYREDLLASFFLLAALLLVDAARRRSGAAAAGARAAALLAALVACLAKESGYLGVILLVLLDVFRRPLPSWRRRLADAGVLALAAGTAFVWRWWVFGAPAIVSRTAELPAERFHRASALLAGCRSFLAGALQYLWPAGLSPEYASPPVSGWGLALALGGAAVLLAATLLALRALVAGSRDRPALAALGFLWALTAYLPHLGLVPLTNLRADRYFYLAGPGLALLVVAGGQRLLARLPRREPSSDRPAALLLAGLLLSLALRSWTQSRVWRDDRALFQAAVTRAPGVPRAWRGLANAHLSQGRTLQALAAVDRALALGEDAHSRELRGLVLMRQGQLQLARADLLRALEASGPGHRPRVLNNLGYVEQRLGHQPSALDRFAQARQLAPAFDRPYLNAARSHQQLGQVAAAEQMLRALVTTIPGSIDGWLQLGALLQERGQTGEAAQARARAQALSGGAR